MPARGLRTVHTTFSKETLFRDLTDFADQNVSIWSGFGFGVQRWFWVGRYLHEVGGGGDDGHHDAADDEAHEHATIRTSPRAEDEERQLAVCGRQRPVCQACTVGVAERQDGREQVADQDIVPLDGREDLGEHSDGDGSQCNVAREGHPRWDSFLHEDIGSAGVVSVCDVELVCTQWHFQTFFLRGGKLSSD